MVNVSQDVNAYVNACLVYARCKNNLPSHLSVNFTEARDPVAAEIMSLIIEILIEAINYQNLRFCDRLNRTLLLNARIMLRHLKLRRMMNAQAWRK